MVYRTTSYCMPEGVTAAALPFSMPLDGVTPYSKTTSWSGSHTAEAITSRRMSFGAPVSCVFRTFLPPVSGVISLFWRVGSSDGHLPSGPIGVAFAQGPNTDRGGREFEVNEKPDLSARIWARDEFNEYGPVRNPELRSAMSSPSKRTRRIARRGRAGGGASL